MFREHEALIDINNALQSSPDNLFSRYLRAQIQLALENYHEALLDLDTFIDAYPELAHARYLRARTLDEDLDDPEKALPDIEVAVSVESDPMLAEAGQTEVASSDDPMEVAKGILQQAQIMEDDVKAMQADIDQKKAEAYAMAPELTPKKGPGRPKKVV